MADQGDLQALQNDYDISGELRGSDDARYYIGRKRDESAAEVAITVVRAAKDGAKSDLNHFASDAQILASGVHPSMARVIDGKWVGNDSCALITERIDGEPLDELLARGEKFSTPRVAMILEQVNAVLDWARERGVVHRGVTPDSLYLERAGDRVRMVLSPTPIPMSGVPDACGDARTIGHLAWAFLSGAPHASTETRTFAEICPNLATRVIDAVDNLIKCKDHQDNAPDVGRFLGIIAAGDVLKQAEVELAAQKEEYDEAHRIELQKCEVQRQETEQHAAEQASMLAGEREEFRRQMEEERAAMDAERAQFEALMAERKERFAQVRTELDQQRAELERRLAELEGYRAEVEKVREDALKAREEANASAREAAKIATAKMMLNDRAEAAATEPEKYERPVLKKLDKVIDRIKIEKAGLDAPKIAKPPKAPKWDKIESVDLEHTDIEELPPSRPRWMIPAGVATLILLLVVGIYGITHREKDPGSTVRLGKSTIVPTAPNAPQGYTPRGGFLTQSAGGNVSGGFTGSPVVTPTDSATAANAAALVTATPTAPDPDSVAAAQAARERRAAAREAARRRAEQAAADSASMPPGFFNSPRPASVPPDSVRPTTIRPPIDSFSLARPRVDSAVKRDSTRRDTTGRRDTIRPPADTTRPPRG
jgi:hypothetical protein